VATFEINQPKIILGVPNAYKQRHSLGEAFDRKVLPDRSLQWNDVVVGALITSVLFNIGKSLLGWYIVSSAIASSYGAAGGLLSGPPICF
jgi:membrane protein